MLFSRDDFRIESIVDLLEFAPIFIFVALVAPFIIAAYSVGFAMDVAGWLKTSS